MTPSRVTTSAPTGGAGPGAGPGVGELAQADTKAAKLAAAARIRLGGAGARGDDGIEAMSNPSSDPKQNPHDTMGARTPSPPLQPGLYVVATPIGNLRDITLRALDILRGAGRVYAEDTRVTRKLLDAYGLKPNLFSYHEHNAGPARAQILAALTRGESVALVSDAGTPLISDPGFKLARAVIEAGFRVFPIPGASAPLAALIASGLPSDRFLFAGFLPPKPGARRAALAALAAIDATLILFETGPRLAASLADMNQAFGPRPAALARELTKLFEEIRRAGLDELAAHYAAAGAPKGEIVIVIAPPPDPAPAEAEQIDAFLRAALTRAGVSQAAAEAATALGVPRRLAYARALALKAGRA